MIPSRMILRCLYAIAFATVARAQAAFEYAAKSGSALSGAGSEMHVGACRLDSTLIPCVKQYYPGAFYLGIVVICLALGTLFYPKRRV